MHPENKNLLYLKQNVVYKWYFPEDPCNQFNVGEYSRCLENKNKGTQYYTNGAVCICYESNNHP